MERKGNAPLIKGDRAELRIRLAGAVPGIGTVDWRTDGDAVGPITSGEARIPAGNALSNQFFVSGNNNDDTRAAVVTVVLDSPKFITNRVGGRPLDNTGVKLVAGPALKLVFDPKPSVSNIKAAPTSISEADGDISQATVTLNRAAPTGGFPVALTYSGSATLNVDFAAPSSVTVAQGATSVTFDIVALPDADAAEGDETLTVQAGPASSAQITILDGPVAVPAVVASLAASPESISENGETSTITVTLDRVAPAGGRMFPIAFRGSATRDTDYTASDDGRAVIGATLTFSPGSDTQRITITGLADRLREGDETIIVTVGGVSTTIRLRNVLVESALVEVRRKASTALLRRNSRRFSQLTSDVIASRLNGRRFSRANDDGAVRSSLHEFAGGKNGQPAGPWNVWASMAGSKLRGDADGTVRDVYIGGDILLAPGTTLGVLGSYEWSDLATRGDVAGQHDSTGWSVGGYFGTRLSDNLFVDLSTSYGRFSPELSALFKGETVFGDYDANRYVVSGNVTGRVAYGNLTVLPRLGVVYARAEQGGFTDSSGAIGRAQTLALGRVSFSPTVSYDFDLPPEYGSLEISMTATGFADFARPDDEDKLSMAVRLGFNWEAASGLSVRLDGGYDGIGLDDYKSLDGSVSVGLKF